MTKFRKPASKSTSQKPSHRKPKRPSAASDAILKIRLDATERNLINYAARIVGKNPSDFTLDAARWEAEAVLRDQRLLALDGKAYREFLARLDTPPAPSDALRALLQREAPWK